jgi:hypothetical protein
MARGARTGLGEDRCEHGLADPERITSLVVAAWHMVLDGPHSARDHFFEWGTRVAAMPSGPAERYDFFLSRRGSVAVPAAPRELYRPRRGT